MPLPSCRSYLFALPIALAAYSVHASGDASSDSPNCIAEEPMHYRMKQFRAPTPCTLAGATVLSTAALERLIENGDPVLIDVMPADRRPQGLSDSALWLPPPRSNIAGSVWLPNAGFGELPIEEERYFRDNLVRLTAGNVGRAVVFYCEIECWMSWNAARRAIEWGYRSVYWYPGGIDAWAAAGHRLKGAQPVPRGPTH